MSNKYYKLSRKERKLTHPPETRFIKLTSLALTTFLITFLSLSILTPPQNSSATDLLATLQSTSSTVSLTTSTSPINLSLQAVPAGAVRTVSDTVTVTSGPAGYQLYLSTASASNSLTRDGATSTGTDSTGLPTYASSDLIPAGGGDTISSPVALTDNTWGFAVAQPDSTSGSGSQHVVASGFDSTYPTGDNSSAASKFAKVPIKGSDVLIATHSSTTTNIPTTIYYAVRATSAKPSGTYKNTIVYTAIGSSSATNLASVDPIQTSKITGGETLTIATPSTTALSSLGTITVTVGGKTCTSPSAKKASDGSLNNVTCTAPALSTGWHEVVVNFEGSNETYVVNPGIEYVYAPADVEIATLYELANGKNLQDMTSSICTAAKQDTASTTNFATLKDSRDGQTYRIAKLADGNCWFVDNLRLGNAADNSSIRSVTLTPADSNVSANFTLSTSNIYQDGSGGWWSNDVPYVYSIAGTANASTYGNLYNFPAATAGVGTSAIDDEDVDSSICPKNWHLMSVANFNTLRDKVSITTATQITSAPYLFVYSGIYIGGYANAGSYGGYWTNNSVSTTHGNAFSFTIDGDTRLSPYGANKFGGFSVRCVLD